MITATAAGSLNANDCLSCAHACAIYAIMFSLPYRWQPSKYATKHVRIPAYVVSVFRYAGFGRAAIGGAGGYGLMTGQQAHWHRHSPSHDGTPVPAGNAGFGSSAVHHGEAMSDDSVIVTVGRIRALGLRRGGGHCFRSAHVIASSAVIQAWGFRGAVRAEA